MPSASLPTLAMAAGLSGEAVGTAATIGASLPSLATVATIGSTALSAVGAIGQSRAAAASAGYNAQIAQQNAQLQTQSANFAGSEGEQNVGIQGAKNKAAIAATLANQGASGVDVNSGSSVNTRESEAKLGVLDALTIRSNAAKSAYGYSVGASSQQAQSQLLKSQQGNDVSAGYLNAGSTVLGGLGNAAKYTNWLNSNGL